MGSKKIPISVSEELYSEIKTLSIGTSVNGFIVNAIKKEINNIRTGVAGDLSDEEKVKVLNAGRSIAQIVDETIASQLAVRKNALEGLTDKELATLAVSRLPKQSDESEQEKMIIDLMGCIKGLPGIEDVSGKLNKVMLENERLKMEYKILRGKYEVYKRSNGNEALKAALGGYFKYVFEGIIKYVCDLIARNEWSGFGDEKGESDGEYVRYAHEVEKVMKAMSDDKC